MYRSLYSVLKPLVDSGSTGVLEILHYSNDRGMIYIASGAIIRIKTSDLKGAEAAETIFSWLSFFDQFKEKKLKNKATPKSIQQTKKIMAYLARNDKKIERIIDKTEGCETVFRPTRDNIDSEKDLTPEEQDLARAIDGVKTVIEILIKSELSELEVLLIISSFANKGIIEMTTPHVPISTVENNRFFTILHEVLSDITGPVAEVLVDEVCNAMGMARKNLCKSDIGPMLNFIRKRLDDDERDAFDARGIVAQAFQE